MRSIGGVALGVAGLVFAGAAVVFGATVMDAVRVEEVPVASGTDLPTGPEVLEAPATVGEGLQFSRSGTSYPAVSNREILDAVNQDLFQPDRTPSVDRYLLPSERAAPIQTSRNDRRRREPDLRIVGTAIAGDMAIALVQLEDSIPFAVLLGEEVDGYLVAAVHEESVTLSGNGFEFVFDVMEPRRGRSSNSRNRNGRNQNATEESERALAERVQQMLQGAARGQVMRGGITRELIGAVRLRNSSGVQILTSPSGRGGGGK